MENNKNIIKAKKKFSIILLAIIIFQIIGILVFNKINFNFDDISFIYIKKIITFIIILICIVVDCIFFYKRCYKLNTLVKVQPKKCIIEDFIITYYVNSKDRNYSIHPVVRNIEDNKLYLSYSDYDLSYFNTTTTKMNNNITSENIFRKDGSVVKIGDTAYLYIRRILEVKLNIDSDNNVIWLKTNKSRRKLHYRHVNPKYDINEFNNYNFFEGVVEIENINDNI